MKTLPAILFGVMVCCCGSAFAAQLPRPSAGDPRILVVDYDPVEVVELRGTLGFQTFIEFGSDERIENVAVGDATGWQITPNRAANLLFVKPLAEGPVTNMSVVTNLRHYSFELTARARATVRARDIVYTLRFLYPEAAVANIAPKEAAPAPPAPPQVANAAYSYDGSSKIVPARIFDDGKSTYFQFQESEGFPAIYGLDADGAETVINSYMRGGYVITDQVARGFLLRQGKDVVRVYNDGFKLPRPGPESPKARPRKCWLGICL